MRLDRKLLLIAPTIVLVFVVAGLIYTAVQLRTLVSVSDTLAERRDFFAAVQRGEKPFTAQQAVGVLQFALDVEERRTAALVAVRDTVMALSAIALVSCGILVVGIRSVPREHWPRLSFGRSRTE
ncbi:MAG TPA: hypothetical protein VIP11_08635 [Gemmatimonadaceae bacterium]